MNDLFEMLESMEEGVEEAREHDITKAPFAYPGSKARALEHILPLLPYTSTYVEPFGGSAAVLLARRPVKLEVYNDRFGGIVDFYRCIQNPELLDKLIEWLDLTIQARELFVDYKNRWPEQEDIVARAGMWYYCSVYSFGSIGRNFGRGVRPQASLSGRVRDRLQDFWPVHERLKYVLIENQDWPAIFRDFDTEETVFYVDPPYIDAYKNTYKYELSKAEHAKLLEIIFNCKGFVALSAYKNDYYDQFNWDSIHTWDQFVSMTGQAQTETNYQTIKKERTSVQECLYIKEAN